MVGSSHMAKPRVVYKMRVERIVDHTANVRELGLRLTEPERFEFRAGQFVMLHVPQESKPALRAYSIASDEREQNGISLLFKFIEGGLASQFVWQLQGDENLQFTGPFGRVFFREPPTQQIIFLNTGTGVSQHLSYLLSFNEKYPDLRYRMLFGVRSESDIYHRGLLAQLQARMADFAFEYVLSRPSAEWTGKKGYVQEHMATWDYQKIDSTFYLCGNGAMIKDVKKILIEQDNLDPARILSEAFD